MAQRKSDELRIVLVGKTGVGKSAAGNTILGHEEFNSDLSSSSVTAECDKARGTVDTRKVAVIDTPGIFDTVKSNEEIIGKIKTCMSLAAPGPHVFLMVIQIGRFTDEEKKTVEIIKGIFGEEASKYTMVLFTHGDKLKKKTIEQFVSGSADLKKVTTSGSGFFHAFNNESEDRSQVTALFEKINQLLDQNDGNYYTNELLQKAERAIEEEKLRLQQEHSDLDEQEARNRAERKNKFLDVLIQVGSAAATLFLNVAKAQCTTQ